MKAFLHNRLVNYFPLIASGLLLMALLLPNVDRATPVNRYLLVFDISQSMNVEDATVDQQLGNRLAVSRTAARELIRSLPCGSEVGYAVFTATKTITLLTPLDVCEHYNGLLVSLAAIDGSMRFRNASSVGKGVHQSLRAASTLGDDVAIVMFTDGHEAPPLRHGQTGMPKSEGHDVNGFIIGVGGDQPMRIPKVDNNGQSVGFWQAGEVTQLPPDESRGMPGQELSSLREPHLRQLSQLSGLQYLRLADTDTFVQTLTDTSFAVRQSTPTSIGWIPASIALLLLCLRFVPTKRWRSD
ncbi:MxaL protein [Granulosicoccus antarcticus]|uniref:VWFA domain-containing protein n=1 Tax=Granulosicoccus antarcticus IMCC3135 TaxID=1192854 RepID=A0A2Z2NSQ6_9GAMM|nr:MxaL protein [Granulosicoccus antarcticus]ASJ70204.1 hypothetical protein IMCC3135_00390 [Granulosicoccus antarcticus IMCC3135]